MLRVLITDAFNQVELLGQHVSTFVSLALLAHSKKVVRVCILCASQRRLANLLQSEASEAAE